MQTGVGVRVRTERSCALEPSASSARTARRFLRALLQEAGREEWSDAAELAVSELVTNAVLHAHTALRVRAELLPGRLRVEVADDNPVLPRQRGHDEHARTGRGMELVAAVTDAHGVESRGTSGKVVWFCIGGPEPLGADPGWAEPPTEQVQPDARDVVLLDLPPTLWLAVAAHQEAVLRELTLHRASRATDGLGEVPAEPHQGLADEARGVLDRALDAALAQARAQGASRRPLPEQHPAELPAVPERLDLHLRVRPEQAHAFAVLQDALDEAERLAVADLLLVRPALPELAALRDWACEQVIAQLAGAPASAWRGGEDEREPLAGIRVPGWDDEHVARADRGVLAADEGNRIVAVSRPLAELLGWPVEELLGRRVVALVPPRFREAHVAGFSRQLATGQPELLGLPLQLPVLRRDGSKLECDFVIEREGDPAGRHVFLAWISLREASA